MPSNTTQYGWPYPLSSDLVRDGAEAIEDLAKAVEDTFSGTILQVVTGTTSTVTANATNNYEDTGVTATITPTATTSKVLAIAEHYINVDGSTSKYLGIRLLRGATVIHEPVADATGPYDFGDNTYFNTRASVTVLDSPSTTSATTYKTQFRRYGAGGTVRVNGDGSQTQASTSRIILMEVAE